jgi:hypothetical protein
MRSLLLIILPIAWLACGYYSLWRMAARDVLAIENFGDVLFVVLHLFLGPCSLLGCLIVLPPRFEKCDLRWLNRLLGFKSLIIILSAAMLGGCSVQGSQINACALACRDTAVKMVNREACECFEPAYNKGER